MKKDVNVGLDWDERQQKDLYDAAVHARGLEGSPWFRPRKSATKRFDFWTADFEAENWDGSDGVSAVSLRRQATWFDGKNVHETPEHPHAEDAFLKELITGPYKNQTIYFHHLDYDQAFLMEGIERLGLSPIPIKTHVLVSLEVPLDPSDPEAKVLSFRDSMCLTQTSLKTLTHEFDVKHKKLDVEDGDFFNADYRRNDVVGLHEALTAYFNILGWDIGLTLASTSMRHFRRNYLSRPIFRNRKHHSACRKCLFGGRTETTRFNFEPEKSFHVYDVNSLYPSIMLNLEVPTGPFRQTCEDIEGVGMTFADVREDENYPCLPVRGTKLFFTNGIKRGWFVNEELRAARERGARMKLGTSLVSDTTEKIFSRFVTELYAMRQKAKAEGKTGLSLTVKLLQNALFGKYGQRSEGFNYFFSPDQLPPEGAIALNLKNSFYKIAKETDAEHIIPFIAAQVTAGGRVRMLKEIDKLSDPQSLYMMDTDSMVLDGRYLQSSAKIGDFKYEGEISKFFVFGPKLYFYETADGVMTAKVKGVHATTSAKKLTEGAAFISGRKVTNNDGLLGFLSAAKKSSNGKFAFRKTVTRTYAGEFDKRKVLPDGSTVPFQWESTIPPIGFPNPSFTPVLEAIRRNFRRAFPEIIEKVRIQQAELDAVEQAAVAKEK